DTLIDLGTVTVPMPGTITTIKAWTSLPNNVADTVNNNDTIYVTLQSSLFGNLTINSALPTSGNNYQSFTDLANDLMTYGVCGPVVATVAPGSGPYNEYFYLGDVFGSSSTNTINIKGSNETITWDGSGGGFATVTLDGTDYLTIDSLHIISTTSSAGAAALIASGSSNDTIRNGSMLVNANTA